ncbi:flagellar basal body rod protein FlgC [Alterisphingorhabdus coralli]|uniref:Flagellar basal-body rod protein FlgC n=1 Tax=Alterisphingorhabdus coralli TaxID=3071408 RepID=A0AA97F8Z0_9SPHN|nr:flagellar basal body rod protein FlgC [Parasphingorhabdus sp. SCSIO 66989]WOE76664.1 flagellar basal body rod protein FlgC [Parasphingorhabdus sp. SCSIO 66989]
MNVFDISGRAMSAQLTRMNTTASNLANARTTYSSEAEAYRALKPVFRTTMEENGLATVDVEQVVQSDTQPTRRYDPNNPIADNEGYVWEAGVDEAAELIDMMETARQYQNNVQVLQTAKSLILDTVRMGK